MNHNNHALSVVRECISRGFVLHLSNLAISTDSKNKVLYIEPSPHVIKQHEERVAKAYGGCTLCYGKGYHTTLDYRTSYPDWEFDHNKKHTERRQVVRYCECDRGVQLKQLVKAGQMS